MPRRRRFCRSRLELRCRALGAWTRTWRMSSRRSGGRGSSFSPSSIRMAIGAGNWKADSMLEADYIFLHTLLETGDPGRLQRALTEMMRYQNEDGSWSLFPGWSGEYLAVGEVLLLCQADGDWRGRSAPGQVSRLGPGARRRGGHQHLHQDVSVRAGRIRLRCGSGHSAGDCSISQLVLLQYLRDFFVVAVDSCAAGDHLRQEAVQEDSARAGNRRAVCGRAGRARRCV